MSRRKTVLPVQGHIGHGVYKDFFGLQAEGTEVVGKNIMLHHLSNYCTNDNAADHCDQVIPVEENTIKHNGNIDHPVAEQREILKYFVKNRMITPINHDKRPCFAIDKEKAQGAQQYGKANRDGYAKIAMGVKRH